MIEGTSKLDAVWFCIRGPQKELTTWKADVINNTFSTSINLRFGSGQYTIWAGDNAQRFDGSIRFLVNNHVSEDIRYTSASLYVDSGSSDIINLAAVIAPANLTSLQKLENIHSWITNNIAYDYDAYLRKDIQLVSASQVLRDRKGLCRDFSFLFAALARAANLPTKVVYGEAESGSSWELHAWNEVLIGDKWVSVDSSWDAGYVMNNRFIQSPSKTFLAPDVKSFALTHRVTQTTVH
ncbi:transglutaminase-like enzyme, putative cysteine protease [hydrocarbon metagenome]|uniref:Transglutaminase-like enzyme, putative cysteine protease n=1 Tax=hydrocarbon metagenome TaxID=938273 RepID=A0A0W8E7R3_9ZZZZ